MKYLFSLSFLLVACRAVVPEYTVTPMQQKLDLQKIFREGTSWRLVSAVHVLGNKEYDVADIDEGDGIFWHFGKGTVKVDYIYKGHIESMEGEVSFHTTLYNEQFDPSALKIAIPYEYDRNYKPISIKADTVILEDRLWNVAFSHQTYIRIR